MLTRRGGGQGRPHLPDLQGAAPRPRAALFCPRYQRFLGLRT